jgi:hypothetical protein
VGGLLAVASAGVSGDAATQATCTPNKTTTIVGSNLQANANNAVNTDNTNNANNAVNTDNTNNGQININSQNLSFYDKRIASPFFPFPKSAFGIGFNASY